MTNKEILELIKFDLRIAWSDGHTPTTEEEQKEMWAFIDSLLKKYTKEKNG